MPAFLHAVERFLERAFEAPTRRLFRPRLQPVHLARAIDRALERGGQVGPDRLVVPNDFTLDLHPTDFQSFASWRTRLERDLAAHVLHRSSVRGWRCAGRPVVRLREDATAPRGRARVHASLRDDALLASDDERPTVFGLDGTAVLPAFPQTASRVPAEARGWLDLADGRQFPLTGDTVRIGRALDNDVVIADSRVSRYHAQIQLAHDAFTLVDLGSSNGTRVDSTPVTTWRLRDGDTIHLGGVPIRFRSVR